MTTEREFWLSVRQRDHNEDPDIDLQEIIDVVVSAFPKATNRVLEIGCGYGRLTREINNRLPDVSVFGQDINPGILTEAEQYDPETTFTADDITVVSPVDVVYAVTVFQHLPDQEKRVYIEQASQVLRVGGVLRVQFIEGERNTFCDHWIASETMLSWCHDSGFKHINLSRGLVHPQWTWLTAVKS